MENEIKTRSIRADSETFEKFKLISEEFPNQAQALASLISVYEIEKSKTILPERQVEIESFASYMQKINEIYNHSLLLNNDAEIRIRGEFERQLKSKDATIQDLQDKVNNAELSQKEIGVMKNTLQREVELSKNRITELEKKLAILQEEKEKSDLVIGSLTEVTTEYKIQLKENKTLQKENEDLKSIRSKSEKEIAELQYSNETLKKIIEEQKNESNNLKLSQEKDIAVLNQNHEMNLRLIEEHIALNKNKELLTLKELHSEKTRELHEGYQNKIYELYELLRSKSEEALRRSNDNNQSESKEKKKESQKNTPKETKNE